ncbi:uncharacterized protein LOC133791180 [Humulus lupulus]|uniref:uncharacterized protein LOC133791180 n=1 Tax=Humulus lupulus TaxID=3486 RepID=UPI002B401FB8|nr:uncharacterized protein LOC133791180 [Humulus lupulus]XP_062085085.1 uncharacterized protein LOC133791180 [Humulus lupulus]XP_062085086.1 uncharacterized protein LOC133791180 [Humulus lupulus]
MDQLSKPRRSSGKKQSLGTSGNVLPCKSQALKLEDKLKLEKSSCSYADLHREITKNPQKQQIDGKKIDEDELVKYMSKLPSYLQRGKTLQEKALNVGVLDWGLLERWQYGHKQMPYRNSRYSPSSSNTSSSFSTDGSPTYSTRGHSCSPSRQMTSRPSLQVHLMEHPMEGPSQVKSHGASVATFEPNETTQSGTINIPEKFIVPAPALCKKHPDAKLEKCKKSELDQKRERDTVSKNVNNDQNSDMALQTTKTQGVECLNIEKIQKPNLKSFENTPKGCKTIVLILPRSLPESNHPGELQNSNLTAFAGQKSEGCKKACMAERNSDIPHSCPLPSGVGVKESQVEHLSTLGSGAVKTNCSSGSSYSASVSPKVRLNLPRGSNLAAKKSVVAPACSTSVENSKASEMNSNKARAEKVRSTSPFYRFTITGKMSKSSSLKDNFNAGHQGSTDVSAKSVTPNSLSSAGNDSTSGKSNATSRKSSPLRRFLDPLLKPKAENCHQSVEPLKRGSVPTDRPCKSADGRHVSMALRPGKVKLDMAGCKTVNVNELAQGKKPGPTVHALFRVAVKNGLPLFTFAIDKESNILAATVKKLNATKNDGSSFIYTFFTIQDMKKKNGSWIGQGSKGKGHDYTSNVVAQMKVSDFRFSNLSTQNKFKMREFVLFSVNLRQSDNQTSDFQPNDELAAIVVKIAKKTNNPSSVKEGPENASLSDSECLLEHRSHSNSLDDVQCHSFFSSQDFVSTTVILPSAIHSLPSKGGPSSLVERWSSGGSCDCGGWDMGCKLRILANQNKAHKKLSVSKGCPITDRLELFPQEGGQENQLFFSLSPFKEGVYSVEFNSSLSILQAFSICIAALDSRKLCERSEPSKSLEEKTCGEPILVENAGTSAGSVIEAEVPSYISYPPLSPVGRV